MGPLREDLSRRGLKFVVTGNFITYHSTYGEATGNHKEIDTLLIHCITSSKRDGKWVSVYANYVDNAVLLIAHRNLLSCKSIYFEVSAENTNIDILHGFLGFEHAKCLLTLHYLTGCNTVEKFHNVSKESWTKLFLQINDREIFKAFESLLEEVIRKLLTI